VKPESSPGPGTVEGVVHHFIYTNPESGWGVAAIRPPGAAAPEIAAVGTLLGLRPGESVRLTGRWETDTRFGRQFRVESFLALRPTTADGIAAYLGSGLVPGLGPGMAKRIVERFGVRALSVIETEPKRLLEVPGIGRHRLAAIKAAWREQSVLRDAVIFFSSHGISPAHSVRIVKAWGERAVDRVRENPYRLATAVAGIGFLTADRIAARLEIPRDAPARMEAGLAHVLHEAADEGHVLLPRDELLERAGALLTGDGEAPPAGLLETALESGIGRGELILEGDLAFLPALHAAETGVAARLRGLLESPRPALQLDAPAAVRWFEARQKISLAPAQGDALRAALTERVVVITGGPGTGKTTLVNGIIRILERKQQRIALCAPTGRAARRMSETSGRPAKTIHRLLEYNPVERQFARGVARPLETDCVVLDEASMVDIGLMHRLLTALPATARLVIVGDADQLPSVGPGSVLRDLIASGVVPVRALIEIFRQGEGSAIVRNAHRILHGEMPEMTESEAAGRDFFFIPREEPAAILETVRELVTARIPNRFHLDPVEDIQVLTPMHRGDLGASNLNGVLQADLNPAAGPGARPRGSFLAGDKVMQTRNNYELEVFNGDIGRVVAVEAGGALRVRFDERTLSYQASDAADLLLAYACSVHKSQGSEYPAVVLPLHTQHFMLLQRNLLYTAVTRGKRLVVIVGSRRALGAAVRNDRIRRRYTRLAERLRGAWPA